MGKPMLAACVAALIAVLLTSGCEGPGNVGKVTGKVTLDGQPLADAMVTFTPAAGGAPSAGRTDASGVYSLVYTRDVDGAEIGEHKVKVTTYSAGDPEAEPPVPAMPEKVPAKYNSNTELTATVAAGSNTCDFALESEGDIVQPKTDGTE